QVSNVYTPLYIQVSPIHVVLVQPNALTHPSTLSLHDALPISVCPSQFATRRTLFHVLVGCGLLMLKVSRLKLPVIWLLVSMWLNTLTKSQIWTLLLKV